jgi:hypothetical protein
MSSAAADVLDALLVQAAKHQDALIQQWGRKLLAGAGRGKGKVPRRRRARAAK